MHVLLCLRKLVLEYAILGGLCETWLSAWSYSMMAIMLAIINDLRLPCYILILVSLSC